MIQAGLCEGDQLGTKHDNGRRKSCSVWIRASQHDPQRPVWFFNKLIPSICRARWKNHPIRAIALNHTKDCDVPKNKKQAIYCWRGRQCSSGLETFYAWNDATSDV
jgi:hypothetical protein